jgi:hypothetical protein
MFSTMMMIINFLLTASLTPIRIYKMIFQESKKTQQLKITTIEVHFAGLSQVIVVISLQLQAKIKIQKVQRQWQRKEFLLAQEFILERAIPLG